MDSSSSGELVREGKARVTVRGFANALASRRITNEDLCGWMDTSDEWISQRTGIKTRYWVDDSETTSSLAENSARETFLQSGVEKIDAIVAATLSPDYSFPGLGVQLQHRLGLPNVPAYDIRNQCCGFLYGLELAGALVRAGQYKRVLLVGAEVHSTGMDISTRGRDVAVLFGDGAGSCLVERMEDEVSVGVMTFELIGTELHADGQHLEALWCENPGSAHRPRVTKEMAEDGSVYPRMDGRTVFEHAVRRMSEVSLSLLASHRLSISEVGLFVPHQANLRINERVGRRLGLSDYQVFSTVQKYGNTTAATIPIGMSDAIREGRVKPGMLVLSAAFGSGFTWGAAVFRAL